MLLHVEDKLKMSHYLCCPGRPQNKCVSREADERDIDPMSFVPLHSVCPFDNFSTIPPHSHVTMY